MDLNMEKAYYIFQTEKPMKVNLKMIWNKDLEKWFILLEIFMKDNGLKIKNKAWEKWIGVPKFMMVNGFKISLMDGEHCIGWMIKVKINVLEIGII